MRLIILSFLLLFCVSAYAVPPDDSPYILIRKADNKVIGVGYSKFEGVSNINQYEVKQIEPTEIEKYSKEVKKEQEKAIAENEAQKQIKKDAVKAKFNLTDKELQDLADAIR